MPCLGGENYSDGSLALNGEILFLANLKTVLLRYIAPIGLSGEGNLDIGRLRVGLMPVICPKTASRVSGISISIGPIVIFRRLLRTLISELARELLLLLLLLLLLRLLQRLLLLLLLPIYYV